VLALASPSPVNRGWAQVLDDTLAALVASNTHFKTELDKKVAALTEDPHPYIVECPMGCEL
jgi:hypothetical protein